MSETNIVKEFADGPTADTVDAFGKVAEGPLIKYNPGGFAQFRAETTGLPPARAQFGNEEFWGQLVTPTTTITPTGPKDPTGPTDLDGTGISNDQIDAIVKESDDAHKELMDWYRSSSDDLVDFDKYRLDIPDLKINWDTSDIGYTGYDYRKDPDFLTGDLISADRNFEPIQIPLGGGPTELPKTPTYIPPKDGDKDGPLVRFSPRPAEDRTLPEKAEDDKIASVGVLKPTLTEEASRSLQDILSTIEKPIKAVLGKTQYDVEGPHPRGSDYNNLGESAYKFTLKVEDWIKGLSDEQLKLWETKGIPSETTGRAPVGPKFGKTLANFVRILKNEENIQTQEYGNLQVLAAINMAALISQYGAIGGAIPVLVTVADDLVSATNNMFAKNPEMAGNPIQDFVHGTTWVLGKVLQKTYNNTIGQVLPKIKDTQIIKKKLGNIGEFMKAPRRPTMGTKTVISMPDPDGRIRTDRNISKGIPEAERQQVTAQTTSTVTDPATATGRPINFRNIGKGVPTGTTRPTGDTPVSQEIIKRQLTGTHPTTPTGQTTGTLPKAETSEALTANITDEDKQKIDDGTTVTEQKLTGITIDNVGDIESKDPEGQDIETADLNLEYKKPDESERDKIKEKIERERQEREDQEQARKDADDERKRKAEEDRKKREEQDKQQDKQQDKEVDELPITPPLVDVEIDENAKLDDSPKEQSDDELEYTPETGIEAPDGLYYSTYYNVPVDANGNPFGTSGWDESQYKGETIPTLNMAFGLDPNNPEIGGGKGQKPGGEEMDWNARMQDFRDKNALGENVGSRTNYEVDFGDVDPTIGGGGSVKINMEENPYGLVNPDFPGQGYNEDPSTYQRIADSQTSERWDASINDFVPWNPNLPESKNPDNPQYWGPERDIPQGGGEATGGQKVWTQPEVADHARDTGQLTPERITWENKETGEKWTEVVTPYVYRTGFGWGYDYDTSPPFWLQGNWRVISAPVGGQINLPSP